MESESKGGSEHQLFIAYPACPKDEINLAGLWQVLWQGKKIISGSIFACALLAALIAFTLPKLYRVTTILRAPVNREVTELSVPGVYKADPNKIYNAFLRNLQSKGLRFKYFLKKQFIRHLIEGRGKNVDKFEIFQDTFDSKIGILSGRKDKKDRIAFTTVTLDGADNEHLASWLDEYVAFVDHFTAVSLVNDVQVLLKEKAKYIQEKIETLRMIASRERGDRIVQLKEALVIAKQLKMEKPMGSVSVANDSRENLVSKESGAFFNSQNVPIYFRGSEALQVELEQLQKRRNNDSFIPGLRELQGELAFLENKHVDFNNVHTLRIDQEARGNTTPVKPKPVLITALGCVFGLIMGIFGVLVKRVFMVEKGIV